MSGADTKTAAGFGRNVRTVSGLTFVSRITGLARDAALARVLGAGPVTDAFLFAFMVPNLFRRLFGEGALSAAFLPVYTRLLGQNPEAGRRLGRRVIGGMVIALSLLVLIAEAILLIVGQVTGGGLAARLAMVLLPYAPMVCAVAILGAMLQVRGRFAPTAAAPLLLNGVMILALILPARWLADDPSRHAGLLALAVVVAGVLQVLWSLAALRTGDAPAPAAGDESSPTGGSDVPADTLARRGARDVARHAVPMIIGLGALQLGTLFDGLIASWPSVIGPTIFGFRYPLEPGAMTTITLAQRLYQFPLGVFGIAVATVIFPLLARRAAAGDAAGVRSAVREGLRIVAFIAVPASVGLALVREPLVATLFEGGDFTRGDTVRTAPVVVAYGLGVWAYSAVHVLARAFYALERPNVPVRASLIALAVGVCLNLVLIWTPLREAGLAAATAIAAALQVGLLLRALRGELGVGIIDPETRGSILRSGGLAAVMALAVVGLDGLTRPAIDGALSGWPADATRLLVLVVGGGLVYGGGAAAIRSPELATLLGRSDRG